MPPRKPKSRKTVGNEGGSAFEPQPALRESPVPQSVLNASEFSEEEETGEPSRPGSKLTPGESPRTPDEDPALDPPYPSKEAQGTKTDDTKTVAGDARTEGDVGKRADTHTESPSPKRAVGEAASVTDRGQVSLSGPSTASGGDTCVSLETPPETIVTEHAQTETTLIENVSKHGQTETAPIENVLKRAQTETDINESVTKHDQTETATPKNVTRHAQTEIASMENDTKHDQTDTQTLKNVTKHARIDAPRMENVSKNDKTETTTVENVMKHAQTQTASMENVTRHAKAKIVEPSCLTDENPVCAIVQNKDGQGSQIFQLMSETGLSRWMLVGSFLVLFVCTTACSSGIVWFMMRNQNPLLTPPPPIPPPPVTTSPPCRPCTDLENRLKSLEDAVHDLKNQIDDLHYYTDQKLGTVTAAEGHDCDNIGQTEEQSSTAPQQWEEKFTLISLMSTRLNSSIIEIDLLKTKTNTLKRHIISIREEQERTRKDVDTLRSDLRFQENRTNTLETEYDSLDQRMQNLTNEFESTKTDLRTKTHQAKIGIEGLQTYINNQNPLPNLMVVATLPLYLGVALLYALYFLRPTQQRPGHAQQPGHAQRSSHAPPSAVVVPRKEEVSKPAPSILERVTRPGHLRHAVCIVGFHSSTKTIRTRLAESALEDKVPREHFLIEGHDDILKLPPCQLFFVFIYKDERHVVLENPGLGLGDLRLTTVKAIQKMGASLLIVYYGDEESAHVGDCLFNKRMASVQNQTELSALCKKDRFFSTYQTFTELQIRAIREVVRTELR